jgi:hypothetical protein
MQGRSQVGALRGSDVRAREVAFASGGLQLGFAAIDERWIYEWSAPGFGRSDALVESWFGERVEGPPRYRGFLKERRPGAPLGNLGSSAADEATAARLHERGEAWMRAAERARDALHHAPWAAGAARAGGG